MKYYFQIYEPGKSWSDVPVIDLDFDTRVLAVKHARDTAKEKQREVRMTDNRHLLGGDYFSPDGKI